MLAWCRLAGPLPAPCQPFLHLPPALPHHHQPQHLSQPQPLPQHQHQHQLGGAGEVRAGSSGVGAPQSPSSGWNPSTAVAPHSFHAASAPAISAHCDSGSAQPGSRALGVGPSLSALVSAQSAQGPFSALESAIAAAARSIAAHCDDPAAAQQRTLIRVVCPKAPVAEAGPWGVQTTTAPATVSPRLQHSVPSQDHPASRPRTTVRKQQNPQVLQVPKRRRTGPAGAASLPLSLANPAVLPANGALLSASLHPTRVLPTGCTDLPASVPSDVSEVKLLKPAGVRGVCAAEFVQQMHARTATKTANLGEIYRRSQTRRPRSPRQAPTKAGAIAAGASTSRLLVCSNHTPPLPHTHTYWPPPPPPLGRRHCARRYLLYHS